MSDTPAATLDPLAIAREALELDGQATPGPWSYQHHNGCKSIGKKGPHRQSHIDIEVCCTVGLFNDKEDEANAALLAFARTALPALARAYVELDKKATQLAVAFDLASKRAEKAEDKLKAALAREQALREKLARAREAAFQEFEDYHEMQAAQADGMDCAEQARYHERTAKSIREYPERHATRQRAEVPGDPARAEEQVINRPPFYRVGDNLFTVVEMHDSERHGFPDYFKDTK